MTTMLYDGSNNNNNNNNESTSFRRRKRRRRSIIIIGGSCLMIIFVFLPILYTSNGYIENGIFGEKSTTSTIIQKQTKKKKKVEQSKSNNNFIQKITSNKDIITSSSSTTTNNRRYKSKHQLLLLNEGECQNSKTNKNNNNRWSNKPHKESKINSLFNCDLPGALCKYYYPANFFDINCGLGKEFTYNINIVQSLQLNGTLWNNQQSIGFPTLTMNELCIINDNATTKTTKKKFINTHSTTTSTKKMKSDKMILKNIGEQQQQQHRINSNDDASTTTKTTIRCLTERISFVHVHKAGGSSLQSAYHTISRNRHHAMMEYHTFFIPNKEPPGKLLNVNPQNEAAMEHYKNKALHSLQEATRYPSKDMFNNEQHVIFTVVRDPIERFISSIGQALGGIGSVGNKVGYTIKKECLKSTSKETLHCLAKYIRDNGYWMEIHFMPQVLDIGFTTMWQDVPIAVYPMKPHLKTILNYLGVGSELHVRDGSKSNYRSDPILTNMTIDDYDKETIEIVCHIYEMDVRMQRSLGMEVPRCDPYIPNNYDFDF